MDKKSKDTAIVLEGIELGKPIERANCKLCNSKIREEAEQKWDETRNFNAVYRYVTNEGLKVSYPAVRRHLLFHYEIKKNLDLVKEYASSMDEWIEMQKNPEEAMVRRIAMLEREAMILSVEAEGQKIGERRRTVDTIAKLSSVILAYHDKLHDLRKRREPVTLVINQLQLIIKDEIQNTTPEIHDALINVLDKLENSEELSGLMVDKRGK